MLRVYFQIFKKLYNFFNIYSLYRCISINQNVVEKFIYFSNSTQIVKLAY